MFKQTATRLLAAALPSPWSVEPAWGAGGCRPVACFMRQGRILELNAPDPLHLALRILLWPFALLDWALSLPRELCGFFAHFWRLPNCAPPWPPLP